MPPPCTPFPKHSSTPVPLLLRSTRSHLLPLQAATVVTAISIYPIPETLCTRQLQPAEMATTPALLFLLLLLIVSGAPSPTNADSMTTMAVNEEVLGLVVFKSALSDPTGALSTWTESDATPCSWARVECDPATSRVLRLALDGLSLSGRMPHGLDRLPALQSLSLAHNNLTGPLPPSGLSLLASLRSLDLSYNGFSGELPADVARMGSLRYLDLTGNAFSGPLPPTFPPTLRFLVLSGNQFTGALPDTLASGSPLLLHLNVSGNALSGSPDFAAALWPLTRLRTLDLSRNQFAGPVPAGIAGKLHNLKTLVLAGNRFSGEVPADLGLCPHLAAVDLSGNAFEGRLPDSVSQLASLVSLSAAGNRLSGEVPAWLGKLAAVQHLDLSDNALTGALPDSIGDLKALRYLSLSRNQLSGVIPSSISGCTKLAELHLRGNSLSGGIPDALLDVGLETLDVSSNALTGVLPSGSSTRMAAETLQWLDLSGNRLTGGIPAEMSLFYRLRYLNLSGNSDLRAPMPPELGLLRNLTVLDLRATGLHGAIPADLCESSGGSSSLAVLQLDGNALSGPIPDTIANCSSLYLLSLGHNGLTGPIPAGIGELRKLEILRLEYNKLSGEIPATLGALESLLAVNVSHNRLVGRLPASGVFQSLDGSALEGNLGICSPLVAEPCVMNVPKPLVLDPNQYPHGGGGPGGSGGDGSDDLETNAGGVGPTRKRRVLSVSAMVAISAAVAIVVGVVVITLLNLSARRRALLLHGGHDHEQKKVPVDESIVTATSTAKSSSSPSPSAGGTNKKGNKGKHLAAGKMVTFGPGSSLRSEDLVAGAEALLSRATEVGRGAFGTVYAAPVGDGRGVVAVKKLSAASMVASREEFEREVRVLGKARHPNLLPLKAYYWTPQLQLLITDFAAHGSLEARLHGDQSPAMTWEERFRVVEGTARALAHLHQAFRPPLVHYNVKPSNIFLVDGECTPAVGDFGLARLLLAPGSNKMADGARFQQSGSGVGYVAPELACQSLRVNEKCDIYGLGVLILELVTGRRAVEYGDDDVVVLMDQVRVLLEHGNALDCIDPDMGDDGVPEEEVLPVLKLGMVCTSQIPSNRPSMAEVVQILQVIKAPVGGRGGRMEASF